MTGHDMTAVAEGFREVGDALRAVADELERDDSWGVGLPGGLIARLARYGADVFCELQRASETPGPPPPPPPLGIGRSVAHDYPPSTIGVMVG